ncbi:SOUL family heme-binding protein [Lacunimicrobium album]
MNAFMGAVMGIVALIEGTLGIRTSEEPKYQSVVKEDPFEIRAYPELLIAKTSSGGTEREASNRNFRTLAGYIFGKNRQGEKIGMTAPVLMPDQAGKKGEEIGMTAPVLQKEVDGKFEMIFIMPSRYDRTTLPQPETPEIELGTLPARTLATIRFSGLMTDKAVAEKSKQLLTWIEKQGRKPVSEPIPAQYDPPFAIPFLRRNEIHVEIVP